TESRAFAERCLAFASCRLSWSIAILYERVPPNSTPKEPPVSLQVIAAGVRFGSLADIRERIRDVRFTPLSGHAECQNLPCVDGSGLASQNFTSRRWSVQPCVRPAAFLVGNIISCRLTNAFLP